MAALLVHKQTPPPAIDIASLPPIDQPDVRRAGEKSTDEWFGVYQGEHKIGHTHRVATRSATGWAFRDESSFSIAMLGTPQPLTTTLVAETDDVFALRKFAFTLTSPAATFIASGTSDGRRLEVGYGVDGRTDTHGHSTPRAHPPARRPAAAHRRGATADRHALRQHGVQPPHAPHRDVHLGRRGPRNDRRRRHTAPGRGAAGPHGTRLARARRARRTRGGDARLRPARRAAREGARRRGDWRTPRSRARDAHSPDGARSRVRATPTHSPFA